MSRVGYKKNTDDLRDRRYCTICNKRSYVEFMLKVWVGLIRDYKWYCPKCLNEARDSNFIVLDRGVKVNIPLYDGYDEIFIC